MKKIVKNFLLFVLFIFLFDVGLSIWVITHDLKLRYPGLDFRLSKTGIASWYSRSDKNINTFTASGEKFDDRKKTCASWDYPFGQKLIVINLISGKWVTCRVNDRGPNKRLGRLIDLTRSAFEKISHTRPGLIYVMILPVPDKQPQQLSEPA